MQEQKMQNELLVMVCPIRLTANSGLDGPRIHHESKVNRPETKGLWKICVQCGMDGDADDHHRNPRQ
jgi:hypothetical protein